MVECPGQHLDIERGGGNVARARPASGRGNAGFAPEDPEALDRHGLQPEPGVAVGAVEKESGAQIRLWIGVLLGGLDRVGDGSRGSMARLLITINWPATATNAEMLPIRSEPRPARASR